MQEQKDSDETAAVLVAFSSGAALAKLRRQPAASFKDLLDTLLVYPVVGLRAGRDLQGGL